MITLALLTTLNQHVTPAIPPVIALVDANTALLVLLIAGFLYLAKIVADLKNELRKLKRTLQETNPLPQPTVKPSSPAAASPALITTAAAPTIAPQLVRPAGADELDPNILTAIAAATHFALRGRARIISVSAVVDHLRDWSLEGRRQVLSSHKVR